jgi:hypothetical protein
MTVRHESSVIDALFTPLGACSIEAAINTLERDADDGTLRSPESRVNLAYDVAYTTSTSVNPPSSDNIRRMLSLPQLDPRIRQLANKIFRNCTTTAQKVEAVTRYFHTNYAYSLGLDVPPNQDPLTYFLIEAASGYCEYFASGTAILLRLVGVPTRYVTGFLVTERDPDGKFWIARNMDAHAWVEAWDQESNAWTIVESTSQDDLADSSLTDAWTGGEGSRHLLLIQFIRPYTTTVCWGPSAGSSRSTVSRPRSRCRWRFLERRCLWPCCDVAASRVGRRAGTPRRLRNCWPCTKF